MEEEYNLYNICEKEYEDKMKEEYNRNEPFYRFTENQGLTDGELLFWDRVYTASVIDCGIDGAAARADKAIQLRRAKFGRR